MRVVSFFVKAIVLLAVLIGAVFVVARFQDGPIGLIPGGPLEAGELVESGVSDWNFAASVDTIELQLEEDGNSRTTWILVHRGRAYIPCSLGFPPGKSWHLRADGDGRAVVRIQGRRYLVTLERLKHSPMEPKLVEIVASKYGGGPGGDSGAWFFEIRSRER